MRIIHVVTAFPRRPDDPITPWLVELVRRQRDAGLDASVLAPAFRGGPEHEPTDLPVRRFRYAPAVVETLTHEQSVPDRLRSRPSAVFLLPAYIAGGCAAAIEAGAERPDIVHVHWPMPHALFGAALRRASRGHTALVCSYYSVEVNWVVTRLGWLTPFLAWTIRTADAVTAISTATADAVHEVVDRPVTIIPYAAALPEDMTPAAQVPLADPAAPLRLLFAGRLVERKGVEVLVRAVARLRHQRDAELVIVGAGEREGHIRRTAALEGVESHVHLRGFVSADRLAAEYARCDMFVLPAVFDARGDTEGLGVVLLEALRFERPVIASAVGGIRDIVQDGTTGWLVPPGDAEVLARKILEVAADPDRARRVAARGRAMIARRFSWDRILSETTGVYRQAREARGARLT